MLRLWPEQFAACVLPEAGWLHISAGKQVGRFDGDTSTKLTVTDGLDLLLQDQTWSRRATIELVVSDSLARVIELPWQGSLTTDEQREAYARACFEQTGMALDGEWLVRAAYRRFRGVGLGYALPRSLVMGVQDYLTERQLVLRSIMPLSASAYWRNSIGARGKRTVLLLKESRRLTAMLFEGNKCAGLYVQPMGTGPADAIRRLLRTVEAVFPSILRVELWSSQDASNDAELVKRHLPQASVAMLENAHWN